jgi:hypothetical protein
MRHRYAKTIHERLVAARLLPAADIPQINAIAVVHD